MKNSLPQKLSDLDQIQTLTEKMAVLRSGISDSDRRIKDLSAKLAEAEMRNQVLLELKSNTHKTDIPIKAYSKTSESAACVMIGDWHAEE